MPTDLTLPGSIPGLLRRGSPVVRHDPHPTRGEAVENTLGQLVARLNGWPHLGALEGCDLDLTDPTGRVHAAWWAITRWMVHGADPLSMEERKVLQRLYQAAALHPVDDWPRPRIARFRDLCLKLAGVSHG